MSKKLKIIVFLIIAFGLVISFTIGPEKTVSPQTNPPTFKY